jgi:hypothetical protein
MGAFTSLAGIKSATAGVSGAAGGSDAILKDSEAADYVPPGGMPHDDQVNHALLTDPSTGSATQGFENSLSSIISGLKSFKKQPIVGNTPDGGGNAGANDISVPSGVDA